MTNSAATELNVSTRLSKWQIAVVIFFGVMIPLSLYQRDWKMACLAASQLLLLGFGRKEPQMSLPVKVIWAVATFGLMAASTVLFFKKLLSHKL